MRRECTVRRGWNRTLSVTTTGGRSLSQQRLRRNSQEEDENKCDVFYVKKGGLQGMGAMLWIGSHAAERSRT